jgi:hypothetical protein
MQRCAAFGEKPLSSLILRTTYIIIIIIIIR